MGHWPARVEHVDDRVAEVHFLSIEGRVRHGWVADRSYRLVLEIHVEGDAACADGTLDGRAAFPSHNDGGQIERVVPVVRPCCSRDETPGGPPAFGLVAVPKSRREHPVGEEPFARPAMHAVSRGPHHALAVRVQRAFRSRSAKTPSSESKFLCAYLVVVVTLEWVVDEEQWIHGGQLHLLFTRSGFLASPSPAMSQYDDARPRGHISVSRAGVEGAGRGGPGGRLCLPGPPPSIGPHRSRGPPGPYC